MVEMIRPSWMNDTDDDSSTQGDEDSNNTRTLYSDDEMVADQHYSSDTSTCSEIKRPPVKDSYKWCVCHKGNKTIDNRTKMCKLCSQWYHVTCLGYSKSKIDSICNKIDGKELTCPVCENDKDFKMNYVRQISIRAKYNIQDSDDYFATTSSSSVSQLSSSTLSSESSEEELPDIRMSEDEEPTRPPPKKIPSEMTLAEQDEKIKQWKQKQQPPKQIKRIDPIATQSNRRRLSHMSSATRHSSSNKQVRELKQSIIDRKSPNPIKSMICISCGVRIGMTHSSVVPRSILDKYGLSSKLENNWKNSAFCDQQCLYAHVDTQMRRVEKGIISNLSLIDSMTKCFQKKFSVSDSSLRKELSNFLEMNPNCYVRNQNVSRQISEPPRSVQQRSPPAKKNKLSETREKNVQMLIEKLQNRFDKKEKEIQLTVDIAELAGRIEMASHEFHEESKYKTQMRYIILNIADLKNGSFYFDILNGKFQPEELAQMKVPDMASEELKAERLKNSIEEIEARKQVSDDRNYYLLKHLENRFEIRNFKASISSMDDPIATYLHTSPIQEKPASPRPSAPTETASTNRVIVPKDVISTTEDTTADHANHLMDVNCKICIGQKANTDTPVAIITNEVLATTSKSISQDIGIAKSPEIPLIDSQQMTKPKEPQSKSPKSHETLPRTSGMFVNPPSPPHMTNINDDLEMTILENVSTYIPPVSPVKFQGPKLIWSGDIQTDDNKRISVNGTLMPLLPPLHEINQKLLKKQKLLPTLFKHVATKNNNNLCNFWSYIIHLKENHNGQFCFMQLNSNGKPDGSQMFIPNKKEPNRVDDDDMYAILFHQLFFKNTVYEMEVPTCLSEDFGQIFFVGIGKKTTLNDEPCPNLKARYSTLLPRTKDQIIAIFVNLSTFKAFNANPKKIWCCKGNENPRLSPSYHKKQPVSVLKPTKRKSDEHKHDESNPKKKVTIQVPEQQVHKPHSDEPKSTKPSDPRLAKKTSQNTDPRKPPAPVVEQPKNTETSYYNLNNLFSRLMTQARHFDPSELIAAAEKIIKKNINTKNELIPTEKAQIRENWEPKFSKYMYLLDIGSESPKKNDENLPSPQLWQGDSLDSFLLLEKLHLEPEKLKRLTFQNVNWNLSVEHFKLKNSNKPILPSLGPDMIRKDRYYTPH